MVRILQDERVGKQGRLAVGCSAAVIDGREQRVLLVRRSDSGRWAVPGGYMEPGESLTEACAREVLEETGIRARVGQLVAVYTSPHVLLDYGNEVRLQLVVLHFAAEPAGGSLRTGQESIEARYFSRKDIEQLDMSSFNRQRVEDALNAQARTIVREDISLL